MIEIAILGFFLRLFALNQGFWLDEAIGAIAAKSYSYKDLVTVFLTHDNHPPLYYLILKFWGNIFGFSDISLRMPNVIIGSVCVWLVYRLTKKYYPSISTLVSVLVASSPFLIYYSQEVRMYMLTVFFVLISSYSYLETFEKKSKKIFWMIFSLGVVGLMFTDYVPVFLLPVFPLFALLVKKPKRKWWMYFSISFIPLAALGFLWLPIFKQQMLGGSSVLATLPEWSNVAGGATVKQAVLVWNKFLLGRISIRPQSLYYLALGVFSVPVVASFVSSFRNKKKNELVVFAYLWLFIPLVLCFLASFVFPAFVYFRFTFVVPAYFILIADGINKIKNEKLSLLMTITILFGNILGFVVYSTDALQQREQWREAVQFLERDGKEASAALFEFPEPFAPYKWYSKNTVTGIGGLSEIKAQAGDDILLQNKIANYKTIYYFNYLQDLTDPQNIITKELAREGYKVSKEVGDYPGVGIISIWQKE